MIASNVYNNISTILIYSIKQTRTDSRIYNITSISRNTLHVEKKHVQADVVVLNIITVTITFVKLFETYINYEPFPTRNNTTHKYVHNYCFLVLITT